MTPPRASDKKSLIVGLGKTGLSCARYLSACGVPVAITDSRNDPPGLNELRQELPDIALFLGGFDPAAFAVAEQLVVSPGVPMSEPLIQQAVARGVPVIGDIELFARAAKAPVVAITGSNGKSTVTTLLGAMLRDAGVKAAVGGNLGDPALSLLHDAVELYVLELSSFQLETTFSLQPKVAVVLNISPDHLDRYQDLQAYVDTKATIYRGAEGTVFNRDDPLVMAMRGGGAGEILFTLEAPAAGEFGVRTHRGERWLCHGTERLIRASALKIPGTHNLANALAALAIGTLLRLPREAMLRTLTGFAGLPHRTQFIKESAGVRWYNDSKGTNVGACAAALEGLAGGDATRTVLIAGGVGKGADFAPLAPAVARYARAVILLGRDAPLIAKALDDALGDKVPLIQATDMDDAVLLAAGCAEPGDRVLLSPACASFDMFKDYQQRGEMFVDAVARLIP
ncbi:UDP-N-acetylmuramoyl-L-alanine--D-glutamate ligase [Sedimenticola hydrogenitrophicus]|uniref:UDP-N-acetylmuramoyl-L-alanine--D-glutamate ligase n=1 Tax=Sedimenticola hydrogenitrophicus TaxID=2967975 RepID=UPI0023B203A9|nr:UDP-N-acetylmuramoyl-L-alanine--D-glutamate ligase [Sedimenticola hydrogenitrophicus]